MGWRFHRVLNIIPGVRLNVSKTGVSTSVGPRGADLNIGPHGVTANAGVPGTGLSYRQKVTHHVSGIGVGLLIAGSAFVTWHYFGSDTHQPAVAPQSSQTVSQPIADDDDSGGIPTVTREARTGHSRGAHRQAAAVNEGADVIAAAKPATGVMFVHRNNSDLRAVRSSAAPAIKKLTKGEQVTMIALSDKWAEVRDGDVKGWMRSSILKDTPPGTKTSKRKKKSDA